MTLFECLAIAFSLALSFAGARLVQGLPHAVKKGRRYWVHLCFVAWQLVVTVVAFWVIWSYRDVAWTLPTVALVLLGLGIIYDNACVLIPDDPVSVTSWTDHFYLFRRRYFSGVAVWIVSAGLTSTFLLEMAWLHPARIGHVAVLVVAVTGAASESPRVQAALAISVLVPSLLMSVTFGLLPGSFVSP